MPNFRLKGFAQEVAEAAAWTVRAGQERMNVTATEAVCLGIIVCNLLILCAAAVVFSDGGAPEENNVFDDKVWENEDEMSPHPMNVVINPGFSPRQPPGRMDMDKGGKSD